MGLLGGRGERRGEGGGEEVSAVHGGELSTLYA